MRELITSPTTVVSEILTQQSNKLTTVGSGSLDLCQLSRFEIKYTTEEDRDVEILCNFTPANLIKV